MKRALLFFAFAGLAISITSACASSSDDTSSEADSSTHVDSSSGDAGGEGSVDSHAEDARDTALADTGPGDDTTLDTTVDDTLPSDSFAFDSSFDIGGFDTSFDFGGFDTGGGGDSAALCTGVTCPPGEECCPYAGSPFAGHCYSKACLACCTPTP
jgi:hypothetical protein